MPISPPEQRFCHQALAAVAAWPARSSLTARLAWALGRGLGHNLLQLQLTALLDVRATSAIVGCPGVVAARPDTAQTQGASGKGPRRPNTGGRGAEATGVHAAAGPTPSPFEAETGFVQAVLAGLACSTFARQREFAVELTRQLCQLASARPGSETGATSAATSAAELQCALWVRLALLPPLLPLVYVDKDTSGGSSLRTSLTPTLLTLAHTEWVCTDPEDDAGVGGGNCGDAAATERTAAIVRAASAAAGQSLPQRLQALAQGLLPGSWPAWLRGSQAKLREVAQFDRCGRMHSAATAPGLMAGTSQCLLLCLPPPPPFQVAPPPAASSTSALPNTSAVPSTTPVPSITTARPIAAAAQSPSLLTVTAGSVSGTAARNETAGRPKYIQHSFQAPVPLSIGTSLNDTSCSSIKWDPWSITDAVACPDTSDVYTLPQAAAFLIGAKRHRRPDAAF